jgi:2-methylisocitrate lyase-like PEP mutase family enzyme
MVTTSEKRRAFRALHEAGCFVMPNPWDIGSAKYLQHAGFKALATTSAGFAFSRGRADGAVARADVLAHMSDLAGAVDLPLNADFEAGFAESAEGVGESVRLAVETGVAGLSIEDFTGDRGAPLFPLDAAVARIKAARAAIDAAGADTVLTGRSEGFIRGRPDMDETIKRLKAYGEAGADCLYAPGLTTADQITAIVQAAAPKPVNVLVMGRTMSVADYAALGVRRLSVGSGLAMTAWGGFIRAARELAEHGGFGGFAGAASSADVTPAFR